MNICDCERSHNGLGIGPRGCDCPAAIISERKKFESWFMEMSGSMPCEISSGYVRDILLKLDEYDTYEREDIEFMWNGWCGARGVYPK